MEAPPDSSAIVAAVRWIEQALSGSAATVLATVALASVGLLMLSGRIDFRRGTSIVIGCFLIFGAASIAQGLMATVRGDTAMSVVDIDQPPPSYAKAPSNQPVQGQHSFDPYAGAALPQR